MTDMSSTLRDLVAQGGAPDRLKEAAANLAVFSQWTLAQFLDVVRRLDDRYHSTGRVSVDELYVPLLSLALREEENGRARRLASGAPTMWDRLSAMTLKGLFEPDQDERLGRYRSWVFVKAAFEAHPDMASITVLDYRTEPFATRRRLKERQGFGDGLVKAILGRATEWEMQEWQSNEAYHASFVESDDRSFRRQLGRQLTELGGRDGLETALSFLSDKQRQTLALRYGLDSGAMLTFKDIAASMKLSMSTVSKTADKATRMLKHPEHMEHVRSYVSLREPTILLALTNEVGIVTDDRASRWWDIVEPRDRFALYVMGYWSDISPWLSSKMKRNAFGWIYEKPDAVATGPVVEDEDLEALACLH